LTPAERRFEQLARDAAPRLLGYATRRVDPISDAADIVAEVLLVAWRRFDSVPDDDREALIWLYAVARRVLANHHRGRVRRGELTERLRAELASAPVRERSHDEEALKSFLAELPAADRELITLHAWEGLSLAEAAGVLGLRPAAARKRYERVRRRLRQHLQESQVSDQAGLAHTPASGHA
jgi:RNA polymerase sigma factor (sigma-70 family)